MLVINGSILAMGSCSCVGEDTFPDGVWQKSVFDGANESVYQHNKASNRWKLVQKRIGVAPRSNYICKFYLKKDGQIKVYEGENGGGKVKEVETLTIEQHNELDLKKNGQFVIGIGNE